MSIRTSIWVFALCILTVAPARAGGQGDGAIAPYIGDTTVAVVRFDVARLNPQATLDWMATALKEQNVDAPHLDYFRRWQQPMVDRYQQFLSQLQQAGVKRAYWVVSLEDLPPEDDFLRGVWVASLETNANAQSVINLLGTGQADGGGETALNARRIGGVIVASGPQREVSPNNGSLSAAWSAALAGGSGAAIHVAVVLPPIVNRSLEENLPALRLGGPPIPITTFTRGLQWATVSVGLPPTPRVEMIAQAADAASAKAIVDLIARVQPQLRKNSQAILPFLPAPSALADLAPPTVEGDRARWNLDVRALQPAIARELKAEIYDRSSANMRQILQGFLMYQNGHGQIAPDLQTLVADQDMAPSVLTDPLNPQQQPGFIYLPPRDISKEPEKIPVIYEAWPGGQNVGYADGHVAWLPTREAVEQQVKSAQERQKSVTPGR